MTARPAVKTVRCAIYTRKSTEEGLDQEFNSLDAQRESAEAFVSSQVREGWQCLQERYDDGGYTGGNMERPGLQRLLDDVAARRVDCVVVYKVDRLSRSLLDFARMMEVFDRHNTSFVSVTQQFNTTHSMGRLTLNVLLSFAQFEREIISERTRDKIAATRRKGKWTGGHPVLGYDLDPKGHLVVNAVEAEQVRTIFGLFIEKQGLIPVLVELNHRGWSNKCWVTRAGHEHGGASFSRASLARLLANPVYVGRVRYKDEVHPGEQAALLDEALWSGAQELLMKRGPDKPHVPSESFLRGKIFCAACHVAMTPAYTTRKRTRRYRYYVCTKAQRLGWDRCPSKSLPAGQLEDHVLKRLLHLAQSPNDASLSSIVNPDVVVDATTRPIWEAFTRGQELASPQKAELIEATVDRLEYHGGTGDLVIKFHGDRISVLKGGCSA